MPRIFKEIPLEVDKISYTLHNRTQLRQGLELYWYGQKQSQFGLQYLQLKDGRVLTPERHERNDIFGFQLFDVCNMFADFIDVSKGMELSIVVQPWTDVKLSEEEVNIIKSACKQLIASEHLYIMRQHQWFLAQPWKQLTGLTVEQAIAKLESLGW